MQETLRREILERKIIELGFNQEEFDVFLSPKEGQVGRYEIVLECKTDKVMQKIIGTLDRETYKMIDKYEVVDGGKLEF